MSAAAIITANWPSNSLRSIILSAPRGIIMDRSGEPLVKNTPSLDGVIIPAALPEDPAERQRILDAVEDIFRPESAAWREAAESLVFRANEAVLIKEDLTQEESIRYYSQANTLQGYQHPEISPPRIYERPDLFSCDRV